MNIRLGLSSGVLAFCLGLTVLNSPALATEVPASAPTAEDYGARDRIDSVSIAPDGQHVAAIVSTDGKTRVVAVFDLAHLDQAPFIIPTAPGLEIQGVSFVKNDRMALFLMQKLDIEGTRTHAYRSVITDIKGSFFQTLSLAHSGADKENAGVSFEVRNDMGGFGGMSLVSSLPDDPDNILARDASSGDIYRVNLHKPVFVYEKFYTGSDKYGEETWDLHHKSVLARKSVDFQDGHPYIAFSFRNPDTGAWEEHMRFFVKDHEDAEVLGFTADPNIAILRLNHGADKTAIYQYSVRERKLNEEPLFANAAFDTTGIIVSRNKADYGAIIGYTYDGAREGEVYWADDAMAATSDALKKALGETDVPLIWTDAASGKKMKIDVPQDVAVHIEAMSNDRKVMIVERDGPKLPPEYYIYQDGKGLTPIGKTRPQIKPDALGTTTLIQYPARDGLVLAAYLTKPNPDIWGKGPYPAIVVPHGGPWARDTWGWDPTGWTQYFAARGYVVIQPQYRTSTGWGQKIARAGDNQYGLKMSDDNDDAANWLVSQGLASKGHIALHGYSYGGFAAFEAGARSVSDDTFRCAIAGAGVADLERWKHYAGESRIQREALADTMTGLNPWDHVNDFKIPMLVYHGNRDQRVPFPEGKAMYDKLKAAGKPVQFLELQDMGHQINLWSPQNFHDVLNGVDTFLKTDCGPGGING